MRTKLFPGIPIETPSTEALNARGVEKVAIADQYLAIARKRLKIDAYMLRCIWPALNPFYNRVTFTTIVPGAPGAYQGEAKMCLRLGTVVISLQTEVQKAIFSTQPRRSTKRVSWSRARSSRLQLSTVHFGVHGTVSCRTVLTRHHWTFYICTLTDWCANASALETILGPRVLCVDALYKLTFTYLLTYLDSLGVAKCLHPPNGWRQQHTGVTLVR